MGQRASSFTKVKRQSDSHITSTAEEGICRVQRASHMPDYRFLNIPPCHVLFSSQPPTVCLGFQLLGEVNEHGRSTERKK